MKGKTVNISVAVIIICLAFALIVIASNQSETISNDKSYVLGSSIDYWDCLELKNITELIFLPSNSSDVVTVEGNSSVFYVNHSLSKIRNAYVCSSFKVEVEDNDWYVNRVINVTGNRTSIIMDIHIRWG